MSYVDFVLDVMSTSVSMNTLATIDGVSIDVLDASATAIFFISETDIQNVFKAQTDSEDLTDISSTDIKHFIFMDNWPYNVTLNPVNGMMDQLSSSNPIYVTNTPNKMLLKHDFIRYLAKDLFSTPKGVDLFNNERQLVEHLNSLGNDSFQTDISGLLWKYSTNSTYPVGNELIVDPVTGLKATTNDNTSDENICWVLLNKLLESVPERFKDLGSVIDSSGVFPLPILEGDTINFLFSITPAANQHLLTDVSEISTRRYQIKLVVDDGSGINTLPIDVSSTLLSYSGNIQPVLGGITNDQYPYILDNETPVESLYITSGSGNLVFDKNVDITDILLVGGGAGGSSADDGGDGGEVVHYNTLISSGSNTLTFTVSIGEGGIYDSSGNSTLLTSNVLNLSADGGDGLSKSNGTLFSKNNLYYGGSGGYVDVDASGAAYDGYLGGGGGAGGAGAVYGVMASGDGGYGGGTSTAVQGGIGGDGGTNIGGGNNNGYVGGTGASSYAGGGGGGGGGPPTSSSRQGGRGGTGGGGGDGNTYGTNGGLGRKLRAGGGSGGNGGIGTGGGGGAGGLGGQQGDHYIVGDAEDGKGGTGGSGVCIIVYKKSS
jgi:hypothetical protein